MNIAVFRSTLHLRRISLAWFSFGLTVYGWLIVAFYPLISENAMFLESIQRTWPDELLGAFGGRGLDLATLGGFLGLEYLSLIWVFITGTAVITFARGMLGGAVEDGTMELTLAQPVSRVQVVLFRYFALVAYAGVLSFVTVAAIYLPGLAYKVGVQLDSMALLFGAGWMAMVAIGSLAYAFSAHSATGSRATSITIGVLVAMWLGDVLGGISERAAWLSNVSLFHYWRPASIIDKAQVSSGFWVIFGATAIVCFAASVVVFLRRDVV